MILPLSPLLGVGLLGRIIAPALHPWRGPAALSKVAPKLPQQEPPAFRRCHSPLLPLLFVSNPAFWSEWIAYKTQLFLISPFFPNKMIGMACLLASLVVSGGVAYAAVSRLSVRRSSYKAFTLLNNVPGGSAVDEDTPAALAVTNLLYLLGLCTFSVFLGIVTNEISTRVDQVRHGNFRVPDVGHTVILNYNDQTIPILRQMALAKREGRLRRDKPVVVLADKPKEEMDQDIAVGLSGEYGKCGLTVLTRSGRPSRVEDLDLVSAGSARRVVVLRPGNDGSESTSDDLVDVRARLLIECTALQSVQRPPAVKQRQQRPRRRQRHAPATLLHVPEAITGVAEGESESLVSQIRRNNAGSGSIHSVPERGYVSRLMGQCVIQPGVSSIHADLLTQGVNTVEFYFEKLSRWPFLSKLTYGDAQQRFPQAVLCGVRRSAEGAEASGGKAGLMFNPDSSEQLLPSDMLLFLADSRSSVHAQRRPPRAHGRVGSADAAAAAGEVALKAKNEAPKAALAGDHHLEGRQLAILNWNPGSGDLLGELDEAAAMFSKVRATVLVKPAFAPSLQRHLKELRLRNMSVRVVVGQPVSKKSLRDAGVERADAIVMLQDRRELLFTRDDIEAEDLELSQVSKDAQTLATLVLVQDLLTERAAAGHNHHSLHESAVGPQLIAETHTPRAMELLERIATDLPTGCGWKWQAVDLFIPEDLDSGVLVQVALDPALSDVYEDLLKPQGWDVFLEAPEALGFATDKKKRVTFREVSRRASERGQLAFGIERDGASATSGAQRQLLLNPRKDSSWQLQPGDRVVVFSRPGGSGGR